MATLLRPSEYKKYTDPKFIKKITQWSKELVEWMEENGSGEPLTTKNFDGIETAKEFVRLWFCDAEGMRYSVKILYRDIMAGIARSNIKIE